MAVISKGLTFGATETVTNTKLHTLVDSATVAGIVNADCDTNMGLVDTKLAAITTASKVNGSALTGLANIPAAAGVIPAANLPTATATTPVGAVIIWPTAAAPSGYLFCNGAAVSRTTYADLYAVIGNTYGAGNGSTTFNVPNCKGSVVVGFDASQTEFDALAETGGEKTHVLITAELAAHTHTFAVTRGGNYESGSGQAATTATSNTTGSTGSGTAHNNMPPYLVMNYVIKT